MWTYLAGAQAIIAQYQIFINPTGDEDLKKLLVNCIEEDIHPEIEIEELKELLSMD